MTRSELKISLAEATTTLESVALTDPWLGRNSSEDSVAIAAGEQSERRGTLLVLADGFGGQAAGELASRMATTDLPTRYFGRAGNNYFDDLIEAVAELNAEVHRISLEQGVQSGSSTTLVVALVVNQYVVFVNVGDSRGYLLRNEVVVHRTRDHSLREGGAGSTHREGRLSPVLTQAIGPRPRIFPDISIRKIAADDRILLASDGLTDVVTDEEILGIVSDAPVADAAPRLIELAKKNGSNDNISVVLGHVIDVGRGTSFQIRMNDLDRYLVAPPGLDEPTFEAG